MLNQNKLNASQPVVLLGECHPLLEQLGTADGLFTLGEAAGALKLPRIENAASLARFLDAYLSQVLLSLDLPAICLAHECASRNESRELVTLDMEIAGHHGHRDFASASRRVGQINSGGCVPSGTSAWCNVTFKPLKQDMPRAGTRLFSV